MRNLLLIIIVPDATNSNASGCSSQGPPAELQPGMVLTRDLITADGILLLSKDSALDASLIDQLARFETREGGNINAYVRVR